MQVLQELPGAPRFFVLHLDAVLALFNRRHRIAIEHILDEAGHAIPIPVHQLPILIIDPITPALQTLVLLHDLLLLRQLLLVLGCVENTHII